MRFCKMLLLIAVLVSVPMPALADWDPTQPVKMTVPQLPDPLGWDVRMTFPKVLADDWVCSETGPVTDVHFWVSIKADQIPTIPIEQWPAMVGPIHLSFHKDFRPPTGDFSRPGDLIFEWDVPVDAYKVRFWDQGDQGWFDPNTGEFIPHDHHMIFQVNIPKIPPMFIQRKGEIYWLDIALLNPQLPPTIGWKTSKMTWGPLDDDAVWSDSPPGTVPVWRELRDPLTRESLNMAFVITPEPGTAAILLLAGSVLCLRRRRNA